MKKISAVFAIFFMLAGQIIFTADSNAVCPKSMYEAQYSCMHFTYQGGSLPERYDGAPENIQDRELYRRQFSAGEHIHNIVHAYNYDNKAQIAVVLSSYDPEWQAKVSYSIAKHNPHTGTIESFESIDTISAQTFIELLERLKRIMECCEFRRRQNP